MSGARCLRGAAALLALALLAGAARAASHKDYDQGVTLLAGGRWDAARQAFERAIASDPRSSSRRDGYFPYYQLGIAWQGAGSCRRALDAWQSEEQQGEIQKSKAAADLRARQSGCRQLLAQLDQLAQRIAQGATEVQPLVAQLEQRAAAARTAEGRAAPQRFGLAPAALRGELAGMGAQAHAAAEEEGRQKLQDLDARLTALRRDLPAAIDAIGAADTAARERAAEQARRAAAEAAKRAAAARAATPPAPLAQAATAFLGGDAAATLAALDAFRPASAQEKAHACLLRGAALHAQALAAAGTASPQLDAARQALAGCGWREQGLALSPRVFSPRFAVFAESIH